MIFLLDEIHFRGNLIDKGLIFSPQVRPRRLPVPHFAEFMRRNFPLDAAEKSR